MRKASVSAQLSRTARRFSTVIAPQLTKIDLIPALQKHNKLIIKIADVDRLHEAIKQFVLHNNRHFDPVEFEVRAVGNGGSSTSSESSPVLLMAQFYAEEIVLFEGTRRLLSICLSDQSASTPSIGGNNPLVNPFSDNVNANSGTNNFGTTLAKVRHPISGIKVFEVMESTTFGSSTMSWTITGTMDELNKCRIDSHSSLWRSLLSTCGFSFANEWWSVEHGGIRVGEICPRGSLWEENTVYVEWSEEADNELRLLTLCFGIIQTIREAYPSLMHIVHENQTRQRKTLS